MQYVLTLTAAPAALSPSIVSEAIRALSDANATTADPIQLAVGTAVDIPFDALNIAVALDIVRTALAERAVDVNAQATYGRRKKLLIADMDSTMILGETLDELADFAGLKEQISAITARAMRGELDFEGALDERVGMLAGLPSSALDQVNAGLQLTPGGPALLATMKAAGAYCALVSGGFKPTTSAIRARLGFDEDRGNRLEIADGQLTGKVLRPILGREAKLDTLKELAQARGISLAETVAVGDGANDLAMLTASGMGVAFRAKPAVQEAAEFRINHADLTGLLYLQGYSTAEILFP
jgi:phosphoserine phosphatase